MHLRIQTSIKGTNKKSEVKVQTTGKNNKWQAIKVIDKGSKDREDSYNKANEKGITRDRSTYPLVKQRYRRCQDTYKDSILVQSGYNSNSELAARNTKETRSNEIKIVLEVHTAATGYIERQNKTEVRIG